MTHPLLTALIKDAPSLSPEDLAAAKAVLDKLFADLVVDDPNVLLTNDLIKERLGISKFFKVRNAWAVNAREMAAFLDKCYPGVKDVVRVALFKMCIELVISHLKARKVPVTFGTVWVDLVRVPELYDSAFPGYRESGLCDLIIKAMSRSKHVLSNDFSSKANRS